MKKIKKSNSICYRMRRNISSIIWIFLKKNNSSKQDKSCFKYLPYSIQELKQHLELQFEPWMTWKNYSRYISKTWNDQDSSTWTWQIDHIVPQSCLPYLSMEEENFKTKCWALENLRLLSAKQNHHDGCTKVRHKINES